MFQMKQFDFTLATAGADTSADYLRYMAKTALEDTPVLGVQLFALCDYMHMCQLFADKS
jgi:hypothetical protein